MRRYILHSIFFGIIFILCSEFSQAQSGWNADANKFFIRHANDWSKKYFTITTSGDIGIGTPSPNEKLHVVGGIYANKDNPLGQLTLQSFSTYTNRISGVNYKVDGVDLWQTYTDNADGNNFFIRYNGNNANRFFTVTPSGNIGVGTTTPGSYKLAVEGKIGAREVNVTLASWSDFVFFDSYKLRPLSEVETFIQQNKHLPDVPSAAVVEKEGVNLGEMDAILLRKIEELTLYMIELKKGSSFQKNEI